MITRSLGIGILTLLTLASPLFLLVPQASAAALPSRGSVPVGSASYPVPAGAIIVSPNGNNANPGTVGAPVRNLQTAFNKVPLGGTVVLRGGVYHDSGVTARTVTVQNYPNEIVWLDGSVVLTGWVKSGTTWIKSGWTREFSSSMGLDAVTYAMFQTPDAPMAAHPDQVFLNSAQLKQVGAASQVTAGTFYIDNAGDRIIIGSDPTGKEARASDLSRAIALSGDNSVLRGIGIKRYANGYEFKGAAQVNGTGGTVENIVVNDTATVGLSISGTNKTVNRVTVRRAGMLGIGGNINDNSIVQNSISSENNTQGFKAEPVAGGMKFASARTMTIRNNEANSNGRGSGIWFDVSSYNMTIVNNTANSNLKYGIEAEISGKGIIANNITWNNREAGIILFDANNFKVYNNDVGGSNWHGIKLAQDQRRQADGKYPMGMDPRYPGRIDPEVTWLTKDIIITNNVLGNKGNWDRGIYQVYGLDGRSNWSMDNMNVTIDGNLFNKKTDATQPTMVAWGGDDNISLTLYETPAALAAAKNPAWINAQIPGSKRIEDMGPDKITYVWAAKPLPADIAAAIGQPAGSKQLGTKY